MKFAVAFTKVIHSSCFLLLLHSTVMQDEKDQELAYINYETSNP